MNDQEKLDAVTEAFERKLRSLETWDEFKTLLNNITKASVKNFIKNNLQSKSTEYISEASNSEIKAQDYTDLSQEVGNI